MKSNLFNVLNNLTEEDRNNLTIFAIQGEEMNKMRKTAVLLSKSRLNFASKESNEQIVGVKLRVSTGFTYDNDPDNKGILIEEFSMRGQKVYDQFNALPEPPCVVCVEYSTLKKKTILTNIYSLNEVVNTINNLKNQTKGGGQ